MAPTTFDLLAAISMLLLASTDAAPAALAPAADAAPFVLNPLANPAVPSAMTSIVNLPANGTVAAPPIDSTVSPIANIAAVDPTIYTTVTVPPMVFTELSTTTTAPPTIANVQPVPSAVMDPIIIGQPPILAPIGNNTVAETPMSAIVVATATPPVAPVNATVVAPPTPPPQPTPSGAPRFGCGASAAAAALVASALIFFS